MDAPEAQRTLMKALEDFTSRENWDDFFKIRSDKPFEWYGEWSNLAEPLAQHCALHSNNAQLELDILIPGCGNSELSEKLYDAGFKRITNIDFSKVVIGNMLRKCLRTRPGMIWRVMDMTNMQFSDGTFDVVLDKGGLDALMEPKFGPKLGIQFLSEVKRVLRKGGKYVCISLVQTHVIELLFSTFRCGWKVTVHPILQHASSVSSYHPFLVVVLKDDSSAVHLVRTSIDSTSPKYNELQVQGLFETIAKENKLREQHAPGEDLLNDLKDLEIGAKDGMKHLLPGRRMHIMLGEYGISRFNYRAVIMDSYERFGPFSYSSGVFLVPKARANEWLFSSEEGQWEIVENAKAGRLIMVFLDEYHSCIGLEAVQKDLSPLVGGLAPEKSENDESKIPFMMASDGIIKRTIVQEVVSPLTGRIIVEDVCTENGRSDSLSLSTKSEIFRRLVFERCPCLIQSEALLKQSKNLRQDEKMKKSIDDKHHLNSKKKKNRRIGDSGFSVRQEPKANLHVDHYYLASSYHGAMITGFGLILSKLETWVLSKMLIRTVVIGLGAGLLPMFLHKRMPFLQIEAMELDPIVANLAKDYFGFIEDERMKLHIGDGVKMVEEMAKFSKSTGSHDILLTNSIESEFSQANAETSIADVHTSSMKHQSNMEIEDSKGVHVLIIDVDSDDLSTGLSCPHSSFVEESFLRNAKESLCIEGIFILNLVSRSATIHKMVISRLETVFEELFSLDIEEDVNKILFAFPKKSSISTDGIVEGVARLVKLLESSSPWGNGPNIEEFARKIRCVK